MEEKKKSPDSIIIPSFLFFLRLLLTVMFDEVWGRRRHRLLITINNSSMSSDWINWFFSPTFQCEYSALIGTRTNCSVVFFILQCSGLKVSHPLHKDSASVAGSQLEISQSSIDSRLLPVSLHWAEPQRETTTKGLNHSPVSAGTCLDRCELDFGESLTTDSLTDNSPKCTLM